MNKSRLDLEAAILTKMNITTYIFGRFVTSNYKFASARFYVFVMLFLLNANAHANQIVFNSGGILNGQVVDSAGTTIEVNPGDAITGKIFISAYSSHPTNGLTPIGLNATWGGRADNVKLVYPHVEYFGGAPNVQVDFPVVDPLNAPLVAPLTPGLYHIIFAVRSECNQAHVMSATNWRPDIATKDCSNPAPGTGIINPDHADPVWGDGNDLGWDWTDAQFEEVKNTGQITMQTLFPSESNIYRSELYGANWIAVKVVPVPAAAWLFGSGLLGVIAVARRKKH